jgi:hypothetical protein
VSTSDHPAEAVYETADPEQPTVAIDRPDFLKNRTGEPVSDETRAEEGRRLASSG